MNENNDFVHIATAATTVIRSQRGTLKRIVCNDATAGTVTVYNNTSATGDIIAILPIGVLAGTEIEYNLVFDKGLTIETSGADDLTVVFRD